jgi:hypothetical protein
MSLRRRNYSLSGLACILLCWVLACGDGTGPAEVNVTGIWTVTFSDLSGGGFSCSSIAPTTLTLTQTGETVSGAYNGGEVACSGPNGSFSFPAGSGDVVNGEVNGTTISFDLDSPEIHQSGTVTGSSMSGTATWQTFFGTETEAVTLTGTWEADRQ